MVVVVISVAAGLVGSQAPAHLSEGGNEFLSRGTQSYRGAQILAGALGPAAFPNLAVIFPQASPHAPAVLTAVQRVATLVPRGYHSRNHRAVVVIGYFHRGVAAGPTAVRLAREFHRYTGVVVGGPALVQQQLIDQTKSDVLTAELIALPFLLVLALLVFGSVTAALLPLLTALIAVSFTFLALEAINAIQAVSILSLNLVVGLTVGLTLDYSLLLVSRFREELPRRDTTREAAYSTIRSAGRTVAISSATVAVAFASPLVFPIPFLRSLAVGGMVAAMGAGLASLVVLPAVLSLLGSRVDVFALRRPWPARPKQGAWERIAHHVTARPAVAAFAATAVLVALSAPVLGVRLTGFTVSALPASTGSPGFAERVRSEFTYPLLDEVVVAVRAGAHTIAHDLTPAMERLPNVAAGVATHIHGDLWVYNIKAASAPYSGASQALVRDIRALPFHVAVTGLTANYLDTLDVLRADAPYAVATLIGLTLILLFAATGSVVLPLAAVAVNLLTLASALGLVVLIFQAGRFTELLDYRGLRALILTQPVLLGAGAFGVLTDYGVFMLTRMREGWDASMSNTEAVKQGLARTGPIISSAAILFCVAVGVLITAKLIFVKELGFGVVAGVVIDVTIVRALLLPGLMILLGRWSWWRPQWRLPFSARLRRRSASSDAGTLR
jgi:uncharacterized membrane protein YdfJ with MMPL/SSD domain